MKKISFVVLLGFLMVACGRVPEACWYINDAQGWRGGDLHFQVHNNTLLATNSNYNLREYFYGAVDIWNDVLNNRAFVSAESRWYSQNKTPRLGDGINSVFFYLNETRGDALGVAGTRLDRDGYIVEADVHIYLKAIEMYADETCDEFGCNQNEYDKVFHYFLASTMTHEIGHALGLKHNDYDSKSIMTSRARNFEPSASDHKVLECLYGPLGR